MGQGMVVRFQYQHLQGICLSGIQIAIPGQLGQYHIAAIHRPPGVFYGVVTPGGLQHAHQYRGLLHPQGLWLLVKETP